MALKILNEKKESPLVPAKAHALKERTFVSLDGSRIAGPKDKLRKLLGGAGSVIPLEQAVALGLAKGEKAADKAADKEADKEKTEDKSSKPSEDKAAKKGDKADKEKEKA